MEDDIVQKPAPFQAGDRVYVGPVKMEATVIRQIRHYDGSESFWGDLELQYDDVQNLKEMSQRFAELIILECAEMFEGVYTDQHRPERIDTRIKQHFGV